MTFDVCYCLPSGDEHAHHTMKFINSYAANPPMCDHRTIILTDPGPLREEIDLARAVMPNVTVFQHDPGGGKDLARYFAYAEQCNSDLCLFFGGSTYLRRAGWGVRVVRSFESMGRENLYGACGHTGQGPVQPHVRSTGFWCSPQMLRRYPRRPQTHAERYEAEHGSTCMSNWWKSQGHRVWVINWASEHSLEHANDDPQGYARGSQQALLFGDRLTMAPYQPFP